jgi:hypothetical protein
VFPPFGGAVLLGGSGRLTLFSTPFIVGSKQNLLPQRTDQLLSQVHRLLVVAPLGGVLVGIVASPQYSPSAAALTRRAQVLKQLGRIG